ncbi:hypothetical protein HRbin36_00610 [bacterium HR36]|nr:hypothetical protein HRbin36_00610 [bacterium HR36]
MEVSPPSANGVLKPRNAGASHPSSRQAPSYLAPKPPATPAGGLLFLTASLAAYNAAENFCPDKPREVLAMNGHTYRHVRCAKQGEAIILEIATPELHGDLIENELREDLLTAWRDGAGRHVVIDFGQVRYLTSAVLRALIALQRLVKGAGGHALICNVASEAVHRVLTTTRMITSSGSAQSLFEFAADVPAALAWLQNRPAASNPPADAVSH